MEGRNENARPRRMHPALVVTFLLTVASVARAEPYIAVRTGLDCTSCHVNRTGGGMRTAFGSGYGRQSLPWRGMDSSSELFEGVLTDNVRVGSDLRGGYRGNLPDDGRYVGEYEVFSASFYLGVDLISERLTLYVDERFAPGGAANREAFALIRSRKAGMYAKVGRFFLPYGLRFQDDELATRRFTGFNFDNSDTGIELGTGPGPWSVALAVTNGSSGGTETDNGKQVSAIGAYHNGRARLGLSASTNDLPGDTKRTLVGAFAGVKVGDVVVLAHWDEIRDALEGASDTDARTAHLEVDWTPLKGITLRAWAGRFDPDLDLSGDRRDQVGVGVDWTVLPGLQGRAVYRNRDGPAEAPGARDDEAILEIHIYF